MTSEPREIERHGAHITEQAPSESDGYLIHGVAIGEGDVTVGQSGIRKRWPKETLEAAAESLEDRPLIVDHENTSRNVVGKVTSTGYKEGVGVLYEAELYDEELAEKIANELLEVSIRGYHEDPDEMEEDESGAKVVENLKFDNLSIVPVGAAPSNTVEVGGSEEISAAECAEMFVEELGATHTPEWSDTERDSWEAPSLEDFETDDLAEVSKHFLYTETASFPPENYGDLKFPVVSSDGNLNLAALRAAKNRASQADIPADEIQEIKELATRLATEHFEDVDFSEESETATSDDDDITESGTDSAGDVTGSDEETSQSSVADSEDDSNTNMTEDNTENNEELSELRTEVEDLQDEKEDLSTEVDDLEAENEELREEIETVRELYAESLSEASPFSTEELTDKFTVEELSTKFDEMDAVELAGRSDPAPQGGDASAEELSTSEEAEERQEKIAELEEQAEKYEELGMMGAAEKSREKVSELRAE